MLKNTSIQKMSEWYDSQKNPNGDFRKLLQERMDRKYQTTN